MVEADVVAPDGAIVAQYLPVVDNEICIGCGVCEAKCPVVDEPAIYCTSAGSPARTNGTCPWERVADALKSSLRSGHPQGRNRS